MSRTIAIGDIHGYATALAKLIEIIAPQPDVPLDRQTLHTLRWLSLRDYVPPAPHCSGKIAIVGHTPQHKIPDLGYLKCLDTRCYHGGWVTALDVDNGQVNERGELRG